MRVLVVGGYGLIGLEIVRALRAAGMSVVGLGRSANRGRRLVPGIPWIGHDLAKMTRAEDWTASLSDIDAVVNASGALQDGARDDLVLVQERAIGALIAACEQRGVKRYVQISAPGAEAGSKLAFLRTKAAADAALRASSLDWTILKPGLVIGTGAYGGTTLIRMLAAMPTVQPLVMADASVQTVAASDVAGAVRAVLAGEVASRRDYDLVEDKPHSLRDLVKATRRWVGRSDALWVLPMPKWIGFAMAWFADAAGWLGWRSPMRTTALKALAGGVTGDPGPWRQAGGFRLKALEDTFAAIPATMQERVYGRVQLVYPVLLLTLSAFWIVSGVMGFVSREEAEFMLAGRVSPPLSDWIIDLGGTADIVIGLSLLWRRWTRRAAWGAMLLSLVYLVGGSVVTPELWADPLGPFVKVVPGMALALAVAALTEER
jgi:uncharacterized protein YbjT (DUF2867 family)